MVESGLCQLNHEVARDHAVQERQGRRGGISTRDLVAQGIGANLVTPVNGKHLERREYPLSAAVEPQFKIPAVWFEEPNTPRDWFAFRGGER